MGQVIHADTTDGPKQLDIEEASRIKVFVGSIEYTVEAPHVRKMLAAYVLGTSLGQANAHVQEIRKRYLDQMFPPGGGG